MSVRDEVGTSVETVSSRIIMDQVEGLVFPFSCLMSVVFLRECECIRDISNVLLDTLTEYDVWLGCGHALHTTLPYCVDFGVPDTAHWPGLRVKNVGLQFWTGDVVGMMTGVSTLNWMIFSVTLFIDGWVVELVQDTWDCSWCQKWKCQGVINQNWRQPLDVRLSLLQQVKY